MREQKCLRHQNNILYPEKGIACCQEWNVHWEMQLSLSELFFNISIGALGMTIMDVCMMVYWYDYLCQIVCAWNMNDIMKNILIMLCYWRIIPWYLDPFSIISISLCNLQTPPHIPSWTSDPYNSNHYRCHFGNRWFLWYFKYMILGVMGHFKILRWMNQVCHIYKYKINIWDFFLNSIIFGY